MLFKLFWMSLIRSQTNYKFKVGNHIRILKYKNIFANGYTPNCSKEHFVIKKIKSTVPWTYAIKHLNGKKVLEHLRKSIAKDRV